MNNKNIISFVHFLFLPYLNQQEIKQHIIMALTLLEIGLIVTAVVLVVTAIVLFVVLHLTKGRAKHKYKVLPTSQGPRCVPDDANGTTSNSNCAKFTFTGGKCVSDPKGIYPDGSCGGRVVDKYYTCDGFECNEATGVTSHHNDPTCGGNPIRGCAAQNDRIEVKTNPKGFYTEEGTGFNTLGQAMMTDTTNTANTYVFSYTYDGDTNRTTVYRTLFVFDNTGLTAEFKKNSTTNFQISGSVKPVNTRIGNNGNTVFVLSSEGTNTRLSIWSYVNNAWAQGKSIPPIASEGLVPLGVGNESDICVYRNGTNVYQTNLTAKWKQDTSSEPTSAITHCRTINNTETLFYKDPSKGFMIQSASGQKVNPFFVSPLKTSTSNDYTSGDVTADGTKWVTIQNKTVLSYYKRGTQYQGVNDPLKWVYDNKGFYLSPHPISAVCISTDGNMIAYVESSGLCLIGKIDNPSGTYDKFGSHATFYDFEREIVQLSLIQAPNGDTNKYVLLGLDSNKTLHYVMITANLTADLE